MMMNQARKQEGWDMLYPLRRRDIHRDSRVLADAFQRDPIWSKVCEGEADVNRRLRAILEVPLRQALTYGEAYATSDLLEGVVAWVPGDQLDMGMWRLLRCGGLGAAARMGASVAKKAGAAFEPVTEYRRKHLAGRSFLYLLVLGVSAEHKGKGFGGKLVSAAVRESERRGLPLYVGAGSDENVALYEHFGFKVIERIDLPLVGLSNWEMVRESSS